MKKIIFTIAVLLVGFNIINAQLKMTNQQHYEIYTGVAGDTLDSSYELEKTIFLGNKDFKYNYYIEVDADSLGDGTDITARVRGSMNGSDWYNVGSAITWAVSESDTTLVFDGLNPTSSISSTVGSHTQLHTGTSSIAAFNVTADTTGLDGYFADTLAYPEQTITYTDTVTIAAQTITTTETITDGYGYRYLEIYFLGGGANADMELESLRIVILKAE